MIAAALLLAAVSPADAPQAAEPDEIVVLARQLSRMKLRYHVKAGRLATCRVTLSSGSAELDRTACDTARACAADHPELGDRGIAPCIGDRMRSFVQDRRAAAARP